MPYVIEPHEVLAYLNELGYRNISGPQLKEFIRDLKKLIKYDIRVHKQREQEDIENVQPDDVFQTLYETGTTSSKAKEVTRKEKVITVQIKKPKLRKNLEDKNSPSVINSMSTYDTTTRIEGSGVTESVTNDEYIDKTRSKSTSDIIGIRPHNQAKEDQLRPRASFIRPRMQLKPCKSDPVALYHQYQAEWKKQKFPGEENYADLRWAIRERMLGEPPQGFHPAGSVEALSRKRGGSRRT